MSLLERRGVDGVAPLALGLSHTDLSPPSPKTATGTFGDGAHLTESPVKYHQLSWLYPCDRYQADCLNTSAPSTPPLDLFSMHYHLIPPAHNGTVQSDFAAYIKNPRSSLAALVKAAHKGMKSLDWSSACKIIEDAAEEAATFLSQQVNKAMEGHDAVEMLDKAKGCLPSLPATPSLHQIEGLIDAITDLFHDLVMSRSTKSDSSDTDFDGARSLFVIVMGKTALLALVKQGICRQWQTLPDRNNMHWQLALNQALEDFFDTHNNFDLSDLLKMDPVWIGDREKNVWRLVLETGVCIIDNEVDNPSWEQLPTNFEIANQSGWADICTLMRTSHPDPQEVSWERVEE